MEIEIETQKNNMLLNRKEIYFTITHTDEKTPSRAFVGTELANKLNIKRENLVIEYIKPVFGLQKTRCYAKVYTSHGNAKKYERDYLIKRNQTVAGKKEEKTEEKKEKTPEGEKETGDKKEKAEPSAAETEVKTEDDKKEDADKPAMGAEDEKKTAEGEKT